MLYLVLSFKNQFYMDIKIFQFKENLKFMIKFELIMRMRNTIKICLKCQFKRSFLVLNQTSVTLTVVITSTKSSHRRNKAKDYRKFNCPKFSYKPAPYDQSKLKSELWNISAITYKTFKTKKVIVYSLDVASLIDTGSKNKKTLLTESVHSKFSTISNLEHLAIPLIELGNISMKPLGQDIIIRTL